MKNLQRMCAAVALTCALAVAVNAGDISAGGVTSPPPPPPTNSQQATAQGDMQFGVLATLLEALLSVL